MASQDYDEVVDETQSSGEVDYGTGALNKRKKTVFTAWPDESFSPSEVVEVSTPPSTVDERTSPLWRVLLHIAGNRGQVTTIGMDIWRVTVLGRTDPSGSYLPDVDFGPYSGMRMGVSRRHALLRPSQTSLALIDQNSTNGTWVNGQRLSPGRDFSLNDGDRVELGDLRFTIRVMNSPVSLSGR